MHNAITEETTVTETCDNPDNDAYAAARIAELYNLIPGRSPRKDAAFYLDAATSLGGPVLVIGCGTGRLLLEIAREGIEAAGIDRSQAMLDVLERKLALESAEVRRRVVLTQVDMRSFDFPPKKFRLAVIPFRPFQHLIRVEDQLACLCRINRHLAVGGRFILDLFQTNPRRIYGLENMVEREDFDVTLTDGRRLRRTHRLTGFHLVEQYNDVELIHYVTLPGGATERLAQTFAFRYFFRYEAEHLLARCGFRIRDVYGNFDRSPLTSKSPEMIFVTDKVGEPDGDD